MADLVTDMTTAFTTGSTSMLGAIGDIVPVALPVLVAIAVVGVGIRIFKKVAR
jgi:hypothetical protein